MSLWFVLQKSTVTQPELSDNASKKWKQKYNYSSPFISWLINGEDEIIPCMYKRSTYELYLHQKIVKACVIVI